MCLDCHSHSLRFRAASPWIDSNGMVTWCWLLKPSFSPSRLTLSQQKIVLLETQSCNLFLFWNLWFEPQNFLFGCSSDFNSKLSSLVESHLSITLEAAYLECCLEVRNSGEDSMKISAGVWIGMLLLLVALFIHPMIGTYPYYCFLEFHEIDVVLPVLYASVLVMTCCIIFIRRALAPRRPRLMVGRERKWKVLTSPSRRLRMMMSRMATRYIKSMCHSSDGICLLLLTSA